VSDGEGCIVDKLRGERCEICTWLAQRKLVAHDTAISGVVDESGGTYFGASSSPTADAHPLVGRFCTWRSMIWRIESVIAESSHEPATLLRIRKVHDSDHTGADVALEHVELIPHERIVTSMRGPIGITLERMPPLTAERAKTEPAPPPSSVRDVLAQKAALFRDLAGNQKRNAATYRATGYAGEALLCERAAATYLRAAAELEPCEAPPPTHPSAR
jgi:hypothetical protein